jgi:phospholipase C
MGFKNGFNYTRLGVRIPTIAISPWIEKGTLVHEPTVEQKVVESSRFDTTSILATSQKIFGIYDQKLTNRTAWAATFDDLLLTRETPRTDCPKKLPHIPDPKPQDFERFENLKLTNGRKRSIREWCH